MQAPWTEIGRLQSDVSGIRSELGQMAKSYETSQISSNVDRLECTVRDVSASLDGLRSELEGLQNQVSMLMHELEQV